MSEVPDDLMKVARDVAREIGAALAVGSAEAIGRALAAERERLLPTLRLVKSMRAVETLAPAAFQSEIDARREAWAKIDAEIAAILARL